MKRHLSKYALAPLLLLACTKMQAEDVYHTLSYTASSAANFTTGDHLPYFMVANRQGVLSPQGNQGYLRGAIDYRRQREDRKFYWSVGADLIGYASSHFDYYSNNIYLQQCYAEIGGGQYFLTLGSKEQPARFVDSKLSSGNMAWSANTRPVPGLHFGTRDFVKMFIIADLLEGSFDFFYGKMLDGDLNNTRFDHYQSLGDQAPLRTSAVDKAYLHRKSVFLRTPSKYPLYFTAGIEHASFFGGTIRHFDGIWDGSRNEVVYDQTCKWGNALFGGEGHDDDALNHLMTIDARLDYKADKWRAALYKQHYTDDLNSKSFTNIADGLWGLEVKLPRVNWLSHIVIEFVKTNSQGSNQEGLTKILNGQEPLAEDFASDFYQDQRFGGYAYYGMACGSPMVISPLYNPDGYTGYLYNNMQGFHLGIEGSLTRDLSYCLKCNYIKSDGNPWTIALEEMQQVNAPSLLPGYIAPKGNNTSIHLEMTYNQGNWDFTSQLSMDNGSLLGNSFGVGISAIYSGNFVKTVWK